MVVINIRGTHGSGKTTIAKKLIGEGPLHLVPLRYDVVDAPTKSHPNRQLLKEVNGTIYGSHHQHVAIGEYVLACGGCDKFSWKGAHDEIVNGIVDASQIFETVIFEGAIVSSSFERYFNASQEIIRNTAKPVVFVYVQTPLQTCIERAAARSGKGITDRLTHNVKAKHEQMERQYRVAKEAESLMFKAIRFEDPDEAYEWCSERIHG